MNKKALLRTADRIEKYPERYYQGTFGYKGPCGTVCCIAGHTMLAAKKKLTAYPFNKAKNILGLTNKQASALFSGGCLGWPKEYYDRFRVAGSKRERAKVAASLLRALATGKVTIPE
jgi:hypothetical protein